MDDIETVNKIKLFWDAATALLAGWGGGPPGPIVRTFNAWAEAGRSVIRAGDAWASAGRSVEGYVKSRTVEP